MDPQLEELCGKIMSIKVNEENETPSPPDSTPQSPVAPMSSQA